MAKELLCERKDGYLLVRMPVFETVDEVKRVHRIVAGECIKSNCFRVLCDARLQPKPLPILDYYELGTFLGESQQSFQLKVAAVVRPEATYPDRFLEKVCQNRGFDYRWFLEMEEALDWLLNRAERKAPEAKTRRARAYREAGAADLTGR